MDKINRKNNENSIIEKQIEKISIEYNKVLKEVLRERLDLLDRGESKDVSDEQIPYLLEKITVDAEKKRLESGEENRFLILEGASGSGKGTIGRALNEIGIKRMPRITDRQPRPNEIEGEDYYFVSPEEFTKKLKNGDFIGNPAKTYGEKRGIDRKILDDYLISGKFYVEGSARTPLDFFSDSDSSRHKFLSVFLLTQNFNELVRRFRERTAEERNQKADLTISSNEQLLERIKASVAHLEKAKKTVDNRTVSDVFIVNDEIDRACDVIKDLI